MRLSSAGPLSVLTVTALEARRIVARGAARMPRALCDLIDLESAKLIERLRQAPSR